MSCGRRGVGFSTRCAPAVKELSVTPVRTFSIKAGLAASTVTPGSTAPDVSFTTPAMLLVPVWADTAADMSVSQLSVTKLITDLGRLMVFPF
jgi:hypothetical protein